MKTRLLITVALSAGFLLASSTALAQTPEYCDPSTDPDQCECPSGSTYDSCTEVPISSLDTLDDAQALHAAANITSSWNSNINAYDVYIDVTALAAPGVVALPNNHGQWGSPSELYDYMSALIGQSFPVQDSDNDGRIDWPKLNIHQTGTTHRLDTSTGQWVRSSGSLFFDAITTRDGKVCVDEVCTDLFASPQPAYGCQGSGSDSTDSDTDGDLTADQCSHAGGQWVGFSDETCRELDKKQDCGPIAFFAKTKLETRPTEQVRHNPWCEKSPNQIKCELSGPVFVPRIEVDSLLVRNSYFYNFSFDEQISYPETNDVDVLGASTDHNGVCAEGTAKEDGGLLQTTTETRDGQHGSASNFDVCDF